MISIQRKSLARGGTYSVVEVDRGRLEYIRRGKCWIRLSSRMKVKRWSVFSKVFWIYFYFSILDQREGERGFNRKEKISLYGGISVVLR